LRIDSDSPSDELRGQIDRVAPDDRPREGATPEKLEIVPKRGKCASSEVYLSEVFLAVV